MWELNEVHIGTIKIGEVKKAIFKYNGIKEIIKVVPGCGCTDVKLVDNILNVTIKIREFPRHLKHKGSLNIKKNIVIYYKGESKPEVLYIAGKLTQN